VMAVRSSRVGAVLPMVVVVVVSPVGSVIFAREMPARMLWVVGGRKGASYEVKEVGMGAVLASDGRDETRED
jgi:hypothetical protein